MIDPAKLRAKDPETLQGLEKRGFALDWARFGAIDAERKAAKIQAESLRAKKNAAAASVAALKKAGDQAGAAAAIAQGAEISALIDQAARRETLADAEMRDFCMGIPNIPDAAVPFGRGEEDNVIVRNVGTPKQFPFEPAGHQALLENLGLAHFDLAAKIAGARFSCLGGDAARLSRALENFMLDCHAENGYTELYVPYLVNAQAMAGTGQLPKFEQDLFKTTDGRYLIPTAEVPVTNLLAGEILDFDALPLKFCARTPCFRSEAGSAGKDTKGLIRQHQFEKVELVRFEAPEASARAHEEMLFHAESILQKLDLPYRVSKLCGRDLGFSSAITFDLEVWVPGSGCYREISSVSNFKDFQSRRMGLRCERAGKKIPVHTLNGSGLAVGRALLAVVENYQDERGFVAVPDALRPYLGQDALRPAANPFGIAKQQPRAPKPF